MERCFAPTVLNADLTIFHSFGGKELFTKPHGIAIDTKGMVYVTDRDKGVVLKFTPEGEHLATIGSNGELHYQFSEPRGICIDSNDIMYVTDVAKHQVMMFTTEGDFFGNFGCAHSGKPMLEPRGIAVDKNSNVYVCDCEGREVLVSRPVH